MNRKKVKRVELKMGTLKVGMMGKSRELADVMERRKMDALCPGNSVERREGPMYR